MTTADVPWGVLLPTFDALHTGRVPPLVAGARRAEELGFDGAWVGDHLICNAPVLDATMALGAAAAVTERIGLGFSVMLLALRSPSQAARQIATLQAISGGRLSLGVGVGGEHPEEFAAAGVPVARRGRQLDAMLDAVPRLLADQPAGARMPRVIVGGRGEVALRRVMQRGDAWLPMWLAPEVIAESAMQLQRAAAAQGRPAPAVVLLVLVHVDDDLERARRVASDHLMGQYRLPLKVVERWACLGPAAHVAQSLDAYLQAGVTELIVMPLGPDPLQQYERVAAVRQLMPAAA